MKIPKYIMKAIEALVAYCNKHKNCDNCPLSEFCENGKYLAVCDWEIDNE